MTAFAFAVAMAALGVNGPEDAVQHQWDAIGWRAHEDNVRRLRQRIFKAGQDEECSTPEPPPGACLSRMPRRVAPTGLRGARRSNGAGLTRRKPKQWWMVSLGGVSQAC